MAPFNLMILLALDLSHLDVTLSGQAMALLRRGHSLTGASPAWGEVAQQVF